MLFQTRPHVLEYAPLTPLPLPGEATMVANAFPLVFPFFFGAVSEPATGGQGDGWAEYVVGEKITVPCRMQPQGGGARNTVTTEDGQVVEYSDIIYLDTNVPEPPFGATVTVYKDGKVIGVRKVKRFFRGQLHARLWA